MAIWNGVAKVAMLGMLGGAVALAAPVKAEAQGFAVGVQFGHPGYYGYDYAGRRAYWEHERWERERAEAFRREQAWRFHERHDGWAYGRGYGHYGYYGR